MKNNILIGLLITNLVLIGFVIFDGLETKDQISNIKLILEDSNEHDELTDGQLDIYDELGGLNERIDSLQTSLDSIEYEVDEINSGMNELLYYGGFIE